MTATVECVKRLRLKVGDTQAAHRGRALLEDALRVAGNPFPAAAVVLVRHFDVGRIEHGMSSQALALCIEARLAQMAFNAACVDHDDAAHASVVWFRDELSAWGRLLVKLARGEGLSQWYWPVLCERLDQVPRPSGDLLTSSVFARLAQEQGGLLQLAKLVDTLIAQRVAQHVIGLLDARVAQRVLGSLQVDMSAVPEPAAAVRLLCPAPWQALLREQVQQRGEADARVALLALLAFVQANPALLLIADLPALVAGGLRHIATEAATEVASGPPVPVSPGLQTGESSPQQPIRSQAPPWELVGLPVDAPGDQTTSATNEGGHAEFRVAPGARAVASATLAYVAPDGVTLARPAPADARPASTSLPAAEEPTSQARADAPPWLLDPTEHSDHGGFAFLVPVLDRLGLPAILRAQPQLAEINLPARLLAFLAQRLGLAAEDPLRGLIGVTDGRSNVLSRFAAPPQWRQLARPQGSNRASRRWRDPRGRGCEALGMVLLGVDVPAEGAVVMGRPGPFVSLADLERTMYLLAARYLRRYAATSLWLLVRRPARVAVTDTHLDVHFALDAADVRLRRLGLDVDPGWVPWLGKVVTFHYDAGGADG